MSRIWIHIGLHKTGTTAVQQFLWSNRDRLQLRGIKLLSAGRPTEHPLGNHEIPWALKDEDQYPNVLNGLVTEIQSGSGDVIISSEEFDHLGEVEIRRFHSLIAGLGDVKIILYLRNQIDLLESLYRTAIQHFNERRSFDYYLDNFQEFVRLDYSEIIRDWSSQFGEASVIVRNFDTVRDRGGIIEDFCRVTGIRVSETFEMPPGDINHGVPFEVLTALRIMRAHKSDPANENALISWGEQYFSGRGVYKLVGNKRADEFMGKFLAANSEIASRHFSGDVFPKLTSRPSSYDASEDELLGAALHGILSEGWLATRRQSDGEMAPQSQKKSWWRWR